MKALAICFLILTALCLNSTQLSPKAQQGKVAAPIIKTPVGVFEGFVERNLVKFLGIRYGNPPIGNLRFMPSKIYVPANTSQIFPSLSYGSACWQPSRESGMSEDCLFLNIFIPSHAFSLDSPKELLPVMFWIHGGGFLIGSGADYDSQVLAETSGKVIVVSINYRLGPLGLLSSPILSSSTGTSGGMNSVMDQIAALQWVMKFISYFGGDPNRITVFGESAGGVSSGILLISPVLKSMPVQYFTVQSGPLFGLTPLDLNQGYEFSSAACKVAGYGNCNLSQLRATQPQELTSNLLRAGEVVTKRPHTSFGCWLWSVDGYVLPELPRNMLNKLGNEYRLNGKAVITGFVSMDGVISPPLNTGIPPLPKSKKEYQSYIESYFGDNPNQVVLLNSTFYPLSSFNNDPSQAWTQMNADACWVCPTIGLNHAILKQSVKLYTFEFFGANSTLLSAHGGDVYFLFGMSFWAQYFGAGWDDTLSHQMQKAWTNFAINGAPSEINGVVWEQFSTNENVMMLKKDASYLQRHFSQNHHSNVCEFWLNPQQVSSNKLLQMCWEYPSPGWPTIQTNLF